jgi:hypothetical protein
VLLSPIRDFFRRKAIKLPANGAGRRFNHGRLCPHQNNPPFVRAVERCGFALDAAPIFQQLVKRIDPTTYS